LSRAADATPARVCIAVGRQTKLLTFFFGGEKMDGLKIPVMTIELCDPHTQDTGMFYGLRIVEFDINTDTKIITNIVQRDYFHRISVQEAIENLIFYTQRAQKFEEQKIIEEANE
jgi:hypothetical protein